MTMAGVAGQTVKRAIARIGKIRGILVAYTLPSHRCAASEFEIALKTAGFSQLAAGEADGWAKGSFTMP